MVPRFSIRSSRFMPMPLSATVRVRGFGIGRQADPEVGIVRRQLGLGQRRVAQPVAGVGGVGDQLAQEDFLFAVERVRDDIEQAADFGLEAKRSSDIAVSVRYKFSVEIGMGAYSSCQICECREKLHRFVELSRLSSSSSSRATASTAAAILHTGALQAHPSPMLPGHERSILWHGLSDQGRVTAVLGPTNTGKTYLAIERMLAHASGMIGFPLRLLARENYDRMVSAKGRHAVALITGEEKIIPPRARYFVCTVEAMPLDRPVDFLAVDEIQLCADPERGHVFTDRLLHARGMDETMFLGAETIRPLMQRLVPRCRVHQPAALLDADLCRPQEADPPAAALRRRRLLRRRVYAIAELIRRQRGGTAVVMGALSPRTRNAQVALYQAGEVDYLVATDAIGMGLNMDVDHVAFAKLNKFDGHAPRRLRPDRDRPDRRPRRPPHDRRHLRHHRRPQRAGRRDRSTRSRTTSSRR